MTQAETAAASHTRFIAILATALMLLQGNGYDMMVT